MIKTIQTTAMAVWDYTLHKDGEFLYVRMFPTLMPLAEMIESDPKLPNKLKHAVDVINKKGSIEFTKSEDLEKQINRLKSWLKNKNNINLSKTEAKLVYTLIGKLGTVQDEIDLNKYGIKQLMLYIDPAPAKLLKSLKIHMLKLVKNNNK